MGAVLADPPALDLAAPPLGRLAQIRRGLPRSDVLGGVEAGELPAEDLLRRIPLDALRPGVPAHDPTRRVEPEDRVVLHALHQQAEALLALVRGLCGCA